MVEQPSGCSRSTSMTAPTGRLAVCAKLMLPGSCPVCERACFKRSASSFNPSKVVLLRPSLGFGPGSPSKQKCPEKVEKKSDRSEMQQILFRTPIQKRKESVVFNFGTSRP